MPASRLVAFGSNGFGQLGLGHRADTSCADACLFDPVSHSKLPENDKITKAVAGGNHTLVHFKSGAVFATGNNSRGQCGLDASITESRIFQRVRLQDDRTGDAVDLFDDIAATWEASFFVQAGGKIWPCGSGAKGELGLGESFTEATIGSGLLDVSLLLGKQTEIVKIAASVGHVIVLTSSGEVFGWGACRKGQLGTELKTRKVIWTPTEVMVSSRPRNFATGRDFTLFLGGHGESSLLGDCKYLPLELNLRDAEAVEASWNGIYSLSSGRVKAFGRNDRGQCPPDDLPELNMLSAGSEHCLGLSTSCEVLAWGWGEHGNCGRPTDANGNVHGRWNTIDIQLGANEFISSVSAGCATSFVVIDKDV